MLADSGDITTHALAWSNSAAAKIDRKAIPLAGLLAYFVLIECNVRRAYRLDAGLASSIETPVTIAGVPSRDPPSTLMIAARWRGNPRMIPLWIVLTIDPMVLA